MEDEKYLEAVCACFDLISSLFVADAFVGLTDLEKFIKVKQADSFNLSIKEGSRLYTKGKEGGIEKAIATKQRQIIKFPKEYFGFSVNSVSVPVINKSTNNIVGVIGIGVSQEKEQSVLDSSNELLQFSSQLSEAVNHFAASSEELSRNAQDVNKDIDKIQAQLQNMDDILSYVRSIAETTNLLGLNAAIEASRAGEHGRGFGVVATEIRKLAKGSKDSTAQISETLSQLKSDITHVLSFIEGFSQISEEQATQSEELAANTVELNKICERLTKVSNNLF